MVEEVMMVPTKDYAGQLVQRTNHRKHPLEQGRAVGRRTAHDSQQLVHPGCHGRPNGATQGPQIESIDQMHPDGTRLFCSVPDPQGRRGRGRCLNAEHPVGKHVKENHETHQIPQDTGHTLSPAQVDRL